jgi:hypothetical protein
VPVDPVHWLSRPAPGAGPVALLRIFVRRCHGGLGSSRACRESANQKTEGQSAFGAVKFSGAAKAKRRRHYPWLTRRSLANRRLTLAPAGLVALRQTFVRRCHGGWGSSQSLRQHWLTEIGGRREQSQLTANKRPAGSPLVGGLAHLQA